MNNVIKSLLFSLLIATTVSIKSGQTKPPMPTTVTVGTIELPVLYDNESGCYYVLNNGKQIKVNPSNRPGCLSPVSFPR
ncbi:MAG: hypothetical protein LVQ75_04875 [Candidatus Babeliales bacterium]